MQVRNIHGTGFVEKDQIFVQNKYISHHDNVCSTSVRAFTRLVFPGPVSHLMFPELKMSLQVSHFKTLKTSA